MYMFNEMSNCNKLCMTYHKINNDNGYYFKDIVIN